MSVEQYWTGKGIDLDGLWRDFDGGSAYAEKVAAGPLHLLRLTFSQHPPHLPLFDHEVLFKTVKGTFHDVKAECLSPDAYDRAAPIFLHRVDRGSAEYEFLAQVGPMLLWIVALGGAAMQYYRRAFAADEKSDEDRLNFLKTNFANAKLCDVQAYMKAWTTFGRRRVLQRLIAQGLSRVEVSQSPDESPGPSTMLDMKVVVVLETGPFLENQ